MYLKWLFTRRLVVLLCLWIYSWFRRKPVAVSTWRNLFCSWRWFRSRNSRWRTVWSHRSLIQIGTSPNLYWTRPLSPFCTTLCRCSLHRDLVWSCIHWLVSNRVSTISDTCYLVRSVSAFSLLEPLKLVKIKKI